MLDPVTLFQEFFGVRDIMDRMLGYLQAGDNLLISINRDRGFEESFSRFTGSTGIVVAGVRAGGNSQKRKT
jgi:ribosomal protein L21E